MKRVLALTIGALALLIAAACAPPTTVQHNVLPTLVSVTVAQDDSREVVLQGRYFGDGQSGEADDSYIILGADVDGKGGVEVRAQDWSPSRITLTAPMEAGRGFVFVVTGGVKSNGLPANLP